MQRPPLVSGTRGIILNSCPIVMDLIAITEFPTAMICGRFIPLRLLNELKIPTPKYLGRNYP